MITSRKYANGSTPAASQLAASGVSAVHSVAAFASEQGLVLGQVTVDDKENEIVAIPKLLKLFDVRGATVTIDAMGCQLKIAEAIADAGGDLVLQVKDNHPTLRRNLYQFFIDARATDRKLDYPAPELLTFSEVDKGHGRIETRSCWLSHDLSWVEGREAWPGLRAVAMVERTRTDVRSEKTSQESAYFILSDENVGPKRLHELIRGHWGIENSLHWVLDVTFEEDLSRIRLKNAAENMAVVRRAALNLIRNAPEPPKKGKKTTPATLKRKRRVFDINLEYRERILRLTPQDAE